MLSAFISSVESERTPIRQTLYKSLADTIPMSLQLLQVYRGDGEMTKHVIEMCLALMQSLKRQIAPELMQRIMATFFGMFTLEVMQKYANADDASSTMILTGFMRMQKILVEDSANKAMLAYLPEIIGFIGRHGQLILESSGEPCEVGRPLLLELIQAVLVQHWKYFHPQTAVGAAVRSQSSARDGSVQQFDSLMSLMLQVFKLANMELLKQNVGILDDLNARCRMYSHEYFRS